MNGLIIRFITMLTPYALIVTVYHKQAINMSAREEGIAAIHPAGYIPRKVAFLPEMQNQL